MAPCRRMPSGGYPRRGRATYPRGGQHPPAVARVTAPAIEWEGVAKLEHRPAQCAQVDHDIPTPAAPV